MGNGDVSDALAEIFNPSKGTASRPLRKADIAEALKGAVDEVEPAVPKRKAAAAVEVDEPVVIPEVHSRSVSEEAMNKRSKAVDWRKLPPCPIDGFTLKSEGLVRSNETRTQEGKWWWSKPTVKPAVVSPVELCELINACATVEARSKHALDEGYSEMMGERSRYAAWKPLYVLVTAVGGLIWYNVFVSYRSTAPRESVFFKKYLDKLAYSPQRLEQIAVKHKLLMRLTSSRLLATIALGSAFGYAIVVARPHGQDLNVNPVADCHQIMAEHQYFNASSLKWLWAVYYHHPAYETLRAAPIPLPAARILEK